MQIRVRPSVREVVATYTVDDGSMELIVVIPPNFPLGAVRVETGKKVGVGNNLWRNWMLQLTTFLQVPVLACHDLTSDKIVRLLTKHGNCCLCLVQTLHDIYGVDTKIY